MDKEQKDKIKVSMFSLPQLGRQVNSHVHRIAPQPEPDYGAMQRFIQKSARLVTEPNDEEEGRE